MLHHGGNGDGGHDKDGGQVKFGQEEGLDAHRGGGGQAGEVDEGHHIAGGVQGGGAHGVGDQGHHVGAHHPQQDGDDLHHALAPDVGRHNDGHGHDGQPPAGGGVGHRGGSQVQADENDDGAGDHRGQKAHDLFHPHRLDDGGQNHVQKAGHHNAAAGVLQLHGRVHTGVLARVQLGHGLKAAQIGEGGAQESGYLQLGADMEEQRADSGEEQGGLDGQGQAVALDQDGHQHRGPEHGEHVLKAQNQHLGDAQHPGVPDGLASRRFVFAHNDLLSYLNSIRIIIPEAADHSKEKAWRAGNLGILLKAGRKKGMAVVDLRIDKRLRLHYSKTKKRRR